MMARNGASVAGFARLSMLTMLVICGALQDLFDRRFELLARERARDRGTAMVASGA
jgi:hypothetical protein